MHGPYPTATPPSSSLPAPTWPALPRITVLDTVAPSYRLRKRKQWRATRNRILELWAQAHLVFEVIEDRAENYECGGPDNPYYWHWVWEDDENGNHVGGHMEGDEDKYLQSVIVPGVLRLMDLNFLYPDAAVGGMGFWYPETDPGSIAMVPMDDYFFPHSPWERVRVLCHEVGHALGLKHRTEEPAVDTVMNDFETFSNKPDQHDIGSLRRYYNV